MDETAQPAGPRDEPMVELLESIRRRLGRLLVAVSLMTLALILTAAAVFGHLVTYFGRDVMLWGGSTAGAAVLGFVFGWFARRKV